jgi:hypothetical protein
MAQQIFVRPRCPECDVAMIATHGFGADTERKTFECLKCGLIRKPIAPAKRAAA